MSQQKVGELLDLTAVHGFYISVLEQKLGHSVPLPKVAEHPDTDRIDHSIGTMRRWLSVLDLAISPLVIRDSLKDTLKPETSQALLRYFVDKKAHDELDRDKSDCIVTFLFRSSEAASEPWPHGHDHYTGVQQVVSRCEQHLIAMLNQAAESKLPDEHRQLRGEFEFLHQEVEDFRTFDQLMDSGIVQRVRDIKQSFAGSFYHPTVLSHVAVYNFVFGKRFDELFRLTTEQLKTYAVKVQEEGASILSRIEGDITVGELSNVKEAELMNKEYGQAQEHFRKISKFQKVVDNRRRGAPAPAHAHHAAPPPHSSPATHRAAASASPARHRDLEPLSAPPMPAAINELEDSKVRAQMEAIRSFVRISEKSSFVVPLVKGVLNITPIEAETLRADFGMEKSFRAEYANMVGYMLALMARLVVEGEEMKAKQDSAYLWKPHADSIAYLMHSSRYVFDKANVTLATAETRGLDEKVAAMKATMIKLRMAMQQSAALLTALGPRISS